MESNVKEIYIRTITSTSGDVEFYLYNNINCEGDYVINGGLEKVSDDNYETFLVPTINLNKNFSIKVVDSAGCSVCSNRVLPDVTPIVTRVPRPTSTLIIPVTPEPTPSPTEPEVVYGLCYQIEIPFASLQKDFEDLYIEKVDANTGLILNQNYTSYPSITETDTIKIALCSTAFPMFSYGQFGTKFFPASEQITIVTDNNTCQSDNECTI